MTPRCRHGHDSAATDYCDVCGTPLDIGPARDDAPSDLGEAVTDEVKPQAAPVATEWCPRCGAPRVEGARYCEADGHDFLRAAVSWHVEVRADRWQWESVAPDDVPFPGDYAPRTIALEGDEVLIGRGPTSPAAQVIDLGGTPEDKAISRHHAVLRRTEDGTYRLVDCGSTNGTSVNHSAELLAPHVGVDLADGDQIHLGAWTTITVRAS
ncbi:MAG TPA: FHA domain-containing protein [Acidimicrobiales bacterium]|nr:FHA domain-containing protein [Acidimicrobiales bacterium]